MAHEAAAEHAKKRTTSDDRHAHGRSKKQTDPPIIRNVQAIADLERKILDERTHVNRLSEFATRIAGSPAFIVTHLVLVAGWFVLNSTRFAFDRNPFNLLNLILALEAIVLTSIVLIAQGDSRRIADMRAHLDLQVNILAEQELTAILGLLNQICDRVGIDPTEAEPDVEQLAKDTDVKTIATVIEKNSTE